MTRMTMEVDILVEDNGRYKVILAGGVDCEGYTQVYLERKEALEVADFIEALADGTSEEPLEIRDNLSSLAVESYGGRVRIAVNYVRGVLDRQGAREIARGLRTGWEGSE